MKYELTDSTVRQLPVPKAGWKIYRDTNLAGLGCRVLAKTGTRAWVIDYTTRSGRRHIYTLGLTTELKAARARAMAKDLKLRIKHQGYDPAAEHREVRETLTVNELCDQYAQSVEDRLASSRDLCNLIAHDIKPRLGSMKITEVTRDDVQRLHATITKRAPRRADQALGLLRRLFKLESIIPNPTDGLSKNGQRSRERVLDASEIVAVWNAAETIGFPFGPIAQLLILTGQRRAEIAGLRWSEVDLDRKEIVLQPARTKNRRGHTIPLSPEALGIIAALPHPDGAEFLFSTTNTSPVSGFSKAKSAMDRVARLKRPWVLHDIRRSVASHMSDDALAIDVQTVEKLLNHISGSFGGIVSVYNKARMEKRKRHAVDGWARYIMGLISGPASAEILSLEQRRA